MAAAGTGHGDLAVGQAWQKEELAAGRSKAAVGAESMPEEVGHIVGSPDEIAAEIRTSRRRCVEVGRISPGRLLDPQGLAARVLRPFRIALCFLHGRKHLPSVTDFMRRKPRIQPIEIDRFIRELTCFT